MVNIVIPMAGEGSRFIEAGYDKPKPFIDIFGKPMIEHVLQNVACDGARFILVARSEHLKRESAAVQRLSSLYPIQFFGLDNLTLGAAITVLAAHRLLCNQTPLVIANSDQCVDWQMADFLEDARRRNLDGSILCFEDKQRNPKWSFAATNEQGFVREVREKVAISSLATVGIYYFAQGRFFVEGALDMIVADDRTRGEFYTCPVYNHCIRLGQRVGVYVIPATHMHGLGTPEDLRQYQLWYQTRASHPQGRAQSSAER